MKRPDTLLIHSLKEISVFDNGKMGQAGTKYLVDAVMKNSNTQMLMLPSEYQESSYKLKVIFMSTDQCK